MLLSDQISQMIFQHLLPPRKIRIKVLFDKMTGYHFWLGDSRKSLPHEVLRLKAPTFGGYNAQLTTALGTLGNMPRGTFS